LSEGLCVSVAPHREIRVRMALGATWQSVSDR
jgi:hypothetical protein